MNFRNSNFQLSCDLSWKSRIQSRVQWRLLLHIHSSFSPLCAIWHARLQQGTYIWLCLLQQWGPSRGSTFCCSDLSQSGSMVCLNVLSGHPLYLFSWGIHWSAAMGRELDGIWLTRPTPSHQQCCAWNFSSILLYSVLFLWPFAGDSINNNNNNNNRIQRRYSRFLQSPHSATNCLQHARSSGPGAIVCKSRATHRVLITCNMLCYVPLGTKGQLSY